MILLVSDLSTFINANGSELTNWPTRESNQRE